MNNATSLDTYYVVVTNVSYATGDPQRAYRYSLDSGRTYAKSTGTIDYRSPAARRQADAIAAFVTRMRRRFLDAEIIDRLAKGQPCAIAAPPGRLPCPLALRAGRLPLPALRSQNVLAPLPRARRHERQSVPSRTRRRLRTWERES